MSAPFLKPGDYRFDMGLRRGSMDCLLNLGPAALLDERQRLLQSHAEHYIAALDSSEAMVRETAELLERPVDGNLAETLIDLGTHWEADFVLLDTEWRVQAGCVCFPSSWSLPEKLGQCIDVVHAPVPGLNAQMSDKIHAFLGRLRTGDVWQRWNWGLAASPQLNYHPALNMPRLDESARLETTWLRAEEQALLRLPRTQGILFIIRIFVSSLRDEIDASSDFAAMFKHQLLTMPAEVAEYKGLSRCREALVRQLEG